MSPLAVHWERVRRRWVLVLVIGVVAAVGSLAASTVHGTSYTGRSTLTIVSANRAPGQDAVLAQGYADYFDQPATQTALRRRAGVTDTSTVLGARIAAGSPILYVEATGPDPQVAGRSATAMAVALRDDVDAGVGSANRLQRKGMERDLATARARGDANAVSQVQRDLRDLGAGDTNQLRDLQPDAGVAADPTNAARNAAGAVFGGLLLGVVLAAGLGRFENRLATPREVTDRLGLPVLAVVGDRGGLDDGVDPRSTLLRSLTGLTDPFGMPSPGTLAVTGPDSTRATKSTVALAIAGLRAMQGQTTLLLQADLGGPDIAGELVGLPGVSDCLAERAGARVLESTFSSGRGLLVSPPGRRRDGGLTFLSRPRVQRLLLEAVALADLVVVDAPPADGVEGRIVAGAADRSLIVIEEGRTRAKDAVDVRDALHDAGTTAIGVVLVRDPDGLSDLDCPIAGPWAVLLQGRAGRRPVVDGRAAPSVGMMRG